MHIARRRCTGTFFSKRSVISRVFDRPTHDVSFSRRVQRSFPTLPRSTFKSLNGERGRTQRTENESDLIRRSNKSNVTKLR